MVPISRPVAVNGVVETVSSERKLVGIDIPPKARLELAGKLNNTSAGIVN